jgi:U3 small nucleolar ribonucleoprotein protein IMP4
MVVCHMPYGPTAYFGIFNTVLRHDIGQKKEVGTISEVYPHLIMDKFSSQLGQRLGNILKHLFPVPKDDSKRVVTFANDKDYISFRHHTYSAPRGAKSIELKEVRGGWQGGAGVAGGAGVGGEEILLGKKGKGEGCFGGWGKQLS